MFHPVLDNKGEITSVAFCAGTYSKIEILDRVSIKVFIQLPDGDVYVSWMPVFTDWFV